MDNNNIESILKKYRPAGPPADLGQRIFHPHTRKPNLLWLALAAGVMIAFSAGLVRLMLFRPAETVPPEDNLLSFEQTVARAGEAAQMLAAADLLADVSGGQEVAREQYAYVINTYPHTDFVALAKSRIASLNERSFIP